MKNCIIHFLPAKAGDCFVIEFVNKECIIIDCGFKTTYKEYLRPLLINLKNKGCRVTLLLITHIDQDHIEGAIAFLQDNGLANEPNIISIDNIWFNGFFNTLLNRSEFMERIKNYSIKEEQTEKEKEILNDLLIQIPGESKKISAKHSLSFEELCLKNGYCLNTQFLDKTVKRIDNKYQQIRNRSVQIGECKLIVLSPTDKELNDLANKLNLEMIRTFGVDYVISSGYQFIKLLELFMELKTEKCNNEEYISVNSEDLKDWIGTSSMAPMNVINKASIVIEIQYKDIKMLFTGDSDSSLWYKLIDKKYDVIKLSHHGTASPNKELLKNSKADKILISTNGGHGNKHPERETLAQVILEGNNKIYCNYSIPQKDVLDKLQFKYGYQIIYDKREIEL